MYMNTGIGATTRPIGPQSARIVCGAVLFLLQVSTLLVPTATAQDAYEPDNVAADARVISHGQTQNRSIHLAGNVDWFKFTLPTAANTSYALTLETAGASGGHGDLPLRAEQFHGAGG